MDAEDMALMKMNDEQNELSLSIKRPIVVLVNPTAKIEALFNDLIAEIVADPSKVENISEDMAKKVNTIVDLAKQIVEQQALDKIKQIEKHHVEQIANITNTNEVP